MESAATSTKGPINSLKTFIHGRPAGSFRNDFLHLNSVLIFNGILDEEKRSRESSQRFVCRQIHLTQILRRYIRSSCFTLPTVAVFH